MSIAEKLNLSKYANLAVINQPGDYSVFINYPTEFSKTHDALFIFVQTVDEMINHTHHIIKHNLLVEKGYIFFAYPKKGNNRYETFVHRDEIFPAMKVGEDGYVGNSDIKFARMVSMDDVYTVVGLKREKKKVKKTSAASQCVADYEKNVSDVEQLLTENPSELQFFQRLTPGYQKDWARYIFSAKQQKTREKRQAQMVDVLSQGFKTMDLYRLNRK
ncbi:YdeI/OmpD-associated family protein [Bacillus sp. J37]|uniref:YdeI/OmpD-associated family protein n=1 Tax=Bacillus sp. J37 TaxID=935837 RepID=UPI0004794EA6|nr:YdeI/OmpD-associated family protein [Bacillus sp. J37]